MPISTINQNGLTNPLTSVAANTVTSAAATALTLQSAGTTAVTINTSQNVGIGTASPAYKLDVATTSSIVARFARTSFTTAYIVNGSGETYFAGDSSGNTGYGADSTNGRLVLWANAAERMRITSAGELLVGTNAVTPGYGNTNTGQQLGGSSVSSFSRAAADWVMTVNQNTADGSARYLIGFRVSNGQVGNIQSNGSNCTFNSTSDYRLKENILPMTGALATVAQLKPCTYTWKIDGSDGQGFIAHELAEVCPDAVTGEKDAVNEDGSIKPQGIDTSFLVATLTAAIQELKAEFDAYKASHP